MLQTKVQCWFCNNDAQVFVLNKNAWTCPSCDQYNGFTKVLYKNKDSYSTQNFIYFFKQDGDYNKKISEMQETNNKIKYCTNSCSTSYKIKNTSVLCEKCNANQEQKLKELNIYNESNLNVCAFLIKLFDCSGGHLTLF
jgi:Zn finger protein HypA/HybF involved in hydrogenase expression